ncbi:MAG: thioredoxin family protein [Ardenticatenales bacterium]|nr:thioredoxin family protein [Ardenticatenales bacterium]
MKSRTCSESPVGVTRAMHGALALVFGLSLGACQPKADIPAEEAAAPPIVATEPVAAAPHEEVAWFEGDVQTAFDAAKAENKPVFLYWGAVWCPPCYYLKTRVFHRPEFVAASKEFVAVELDGDTERAQIWGEQFDVKGYPTVIVFNPAGDEIMRLTSGIDAEQYASVLVSAKAKMTPIADVLAAVEATGPAAATKEDLDLLAFYAWDQDSVLALESDRKLALFKRLWQETPDSLAVAKNRFLCLWIEALHSARSAAEDAAEEGETPELPAPTADEMPAVLAGLTQVFADPAQRSSNTNTIYYWSEETATMLFPEPGPERDAFSAAWVAAAEAIEGDEAMTVDDRLTAFYPQIILARLKASTAPAASAVVTSTGELTPTAAAVDAASEGDAAADAEPTAIPLPTDLVQRVADRVKWASETVTDPGEMQTVMGTMVWMLQETGQDAAAEQLLNDKLDTTIEPYYYMLELADMAEKKDDTAGALAWYRKGWQTAEGSMSRFRWGHSYLRALLRLTPDDEATFETDATAVLTELMANEDALALGNGDRMGTLSTAIIKWNEDGKHDAVVTRLRDVVAAKCGALDATGEDSQQSRCQQFLVPEVEDATTG